MKNLVIICLIVLFYWLNPTACTLAQDKLAGHWKAVAFYENGKALSVPLDSVALLLDDNGGYEFRSLGHYRESGSYRLAASYLFLTDTSVGPTQEHTLKVLYLSSDSLKIEMNKAAKKQVLFFARRPLGTRMK